MNALRRIATVVLWMLAGVGVLCGGVWAATALGLIQPLIVVSGSMEPGIRIGDLLIDTRTATANVDVGDVVSLHSDLTGGLITHRVVTIAMSGTGDWTVTLKGDANATSDPVPYTAGAQVWRPVLRIPGAGSVVRRMTTPRVVIPLLIGLGALLALALLVPPGDGQADGGSVPDASESADPEIDAKTGSDVGLDPASDPGSGVDVDSAAGGDSVTDGVAAADADSAANQASSAGADPGPPSNPSGAHSVASSAAAVAVSEAW